MSLSFSMDPEIAHWILEFLVRQPLHDRTLDTLLTKLIPLDTNKNHTLYKSILIRQIYSQTEKQNVSQNILVLLERIEEIDRAVGVPATRSMKRAYCQVAVDCTARVKGAEYFEMVKRVWRGRVSKMGDCGLVTEELLGWMEDVEAAVWDREAGERVRGKCKEMDAVGAVKDYVTEAWEGLGPTFLEVVAGMVVRDGVVRNVLGLGKRDKGSRIFELRQEVMSDDVYDATMNTDTMTEVLGMGDNGVLSEQPTINNENDVSQNGTRIPRRKHVAKKRSRGSVAGTSRGAKITDTELVDSSELPDKYGCLPSPAISKVQEALKSSSLELHAIVTDPLPEALQLADNAISTKNRYRRNLEDRAKEADPKRLSTRLGNNVPKLSLMTRNTSAHTFEWDDSIDDLPEGDTGSGSRIKLPSPNNRVVPPLKKHQMRKVMRRRKAWSMLEEETLKTGVEKYGKGCWKVILSSYHDIFEDRTDVDLKDKWRNMIRYTH